MSSRCRILPCSELLFSLRRFHSAEIRQIVFIRFPCTVHDPRWRRILPAAGLRIHGVDLCVGGGESRLLALDRLCSARNQLDFGFLFSVGAWIAAIGIGIRRSAVCRTWNEAGGSDM